MVNELVTNCIKYAFPEGRHGEISVALHENGDEGITLTVGDNGIGFPDDVDFRNTDSLGLQLVNTLAAQLDGTVDLDRTHGTMFTIKFVDHP